MVPGVLIKRENLDIETDIKGRWHADTGRKLPSTSQGEGSRTDPSLTALRRTHPASTLILDHQPPELGENKFLLFKPPDRGILLHSPN